MTDQYYFKAQKRNSCVFSLLGNNIEYSFSGSSREGHEVPIITLTASRPLNASANQLDIFQFAANRNWLGIGHRTYCRLWSWMYHSDYVLVATSALDANVSALSVYYNNIILATFIGIAHGMFPSNILPRKPHICFILHLRVQHYLALGSIEELLSGP